MLANGNHSPFVTNHDLFIGFQFGQPFIQAGDLSGKVTHAAAGDILLIKMVSLEQGEPLESSIGRGKRQRRRVASVPPGATVLPASKE